MLPRRHILDVWELIKDTEDLKSMATITLAIDAIKYMHNEPKKDHLVEALELNEFICFMFPAKRPKNRSLLVSCCLRPGRAPDVRHPQHAQICHQ